MIKKLILLILLLVGQILNYINTTEFFQNQLGQQINYQTFSGYQDIDWYFTKNQAKIYYSLWTLPQSTLETLNIPIIIWLQGGPGESSQFGCFNQIGPIYMTGNKQQGIKLKKQQYGWNFIGHLVCVDQPLNVGFSYDIKNTIVSTVQQASKHFINFLYNFLIQYKWIQHPIFITGQHYAGSYIPVFVRNIISNKTLNFNIKGVSIGNGWVDPYRQINFYDDYLYSLGIISREWRDVTRFYQTQSILRIMRGEYAQSSDYLNFIINNNSVINNYYNKVSTLNFRIYPQQMQEGSINKDFGVFLQQYKDQFGVPPNIIYYFANDAIYNANKKEISQSKLQSLEIVIISYQILNKGINILIYNGQNDIIVNTPSVLNYINSMKWNGINQWKINPKKLMKQNDLVTGYYKANGNFAFALVNNAGQMAPSDQPIVVRNLIFRLITNNW